MQFFQQIGLWYNADKIMNWNCTVLMINTLSGYVSHFCITGTKTQGKHYVHRTPQCSSPEIYMLTGAKHSAVNVKLWKFDNSKLVLRFTTSFSNQRDAIWYVFMDAHLNDRVPIIETVANYCQCCINFATSVICFPRWSSYNACCKCLMHKHFMNTRK